MGLFSFEKNEFENNIEKSEENTKISNRTEKEEQKPYISQLGACIITKLF